MWVITLWTIIILVSQFRRRIELSNACCESLKTYTFVPFASLKMHSVAKKIMIASLVVSHGTIFMLHVFTLFIMISWRTVHTIFLQETANWHSK